MNSIRKIQDKDIPYLEKICLQTAADNLKNSSKNIENTLLLFNRYYTRAQQDNCFALVNDNDEAVGYILSCPDYKHYRKSFFQHEYKQISKLGLKYKIMAFGEVYSLLPFYKKYPAHLHIDILPEYQGGGNGTQLLTTLCHHLACSGVKGVMLITGADNKGAIRFYKRNGFIKKINFFGAYVMAKKL